ncbi:MAG: hypothetical protein AABX53_00890 [Nanoarchaeota archaeon]
MNGDWRTLVICLGLAIAYSSIVGAVSLSIDNVNSTLATVSIAGASGIYSYEANLDFTGTIGSVAHFNFLGTTDIATYGYSTRGGIVSGYGSSLNASDDYLGVSGSGELFNVTHTGGTVSLRYLLVVAASGSEDYVYYNATSSETTGDTGGGSSGGSGGNSTVIVNNQSNATSKETEDDSGIIDNITETIGDILPPMLSPYLLYVILVGTVVFFVVVAYIVFWLIKRARKRKLLGAKSEKPSVISPV